MAAPRKQKRVEKEMENLENENDDHDEESNEDEEDMEEFSEEEEDEAVGQEVQVDFEARNPEDSDFHGIRKLLQQLFLKANINLSELSDTIISQNYIGSIIRQIEGSSEEDDDDDIMDVDDIFGVISVINVTERKDLESVKELKSYLLNKCHKCSPKYHEKLSSVLNGSSHQVGLVINERFINIPAQIALPSFDSLWKEVERAKKKKMKYDFDYILMISKTYKLQIAPGATASGKKGGTVQESPLMFTNEEEEYFRDEAELNFEYSVKEERDTMVDGGWDGEEGEMEPLRTVMLIPGEKITSVMQKLQDNLALPVSQ